MIINKRIIGGDIINGNYVILEKDDIRILVEGLPDNIDCTLEEIWEDALDMAENNSPGYTILN